MIELSANFTGFDISRILSSGLAEQKLFYFYYEINIIGIFINLFFFPKWII